MAVVVRKSPSELSICIYTHSAASQLQNEGLEGGGGALLNTKEREKDHLAPFGPLWGAPAGSPSGGVALYP